MVTFYEYFFYRACWYYVKILKEQDGEAIFSSALVMGLFQGLNCMVIIDSITYLGFDINIKNVWYYWIPETIIIICNYMYFSRRNREKRIIATWKKAPRGQKIILDTILVIYLLVTLALAIGLAYMIRNNLKL